MNYSALLKSYVNEVFAFKQYKRLPIGIRIVAIIALLPFILAAGFLLVTYAVYNFFFNIINSGVSYLESWQQNKRDGIKHATEAVLYFVTMPFIFSIHVLLSFFACIAFLIWFFMQCFTFIATLGGVRFQPYINNTDFSAEALNYKPTSNLTVSKILYIISFAILMLAIILLIIATEVYELTMVGRAFIFIYLVYTIIAVISCSKKEEISDDEINESQNDIFFD
ncbi:MAG: hypothetical protein J6B16_05115 [Clostridia bacterium]|nr:hypothetical protein [Clostridia bacterium]